MSVSLLLGLVYLISESRKGIAEIEHARSGIARVDGNAAR